MGNNQTDPLAPIERLLGDVLDCAASNDLSIAWPAMQASREAVRLLLDVARYAAMEHPTLDDLLAFARGLEEK